MVRLNRRRAGTVCLRRGRSGVVRRGLVACACVCMCGVAVAVAVAAAALASLSRDAQAQTMPPIAAGNGSGFDLRLFRPAVDTKGYFSVNGSDILGAWDFAFGLVVDWGHGLARVGRDTNDPLGARRVPLVENLLSGTFSANLGLANFMVVGLTLPLHVAQGPAARGLDVAGYDSGASGWSHQGVGDLGVHVKFRILRAEQTHVGLAAVLRAGIPLGGSRAFSGEPGFALWPTLVFEWRPSRLFRLAVEAGYRHVFGTGSSLPQQSDGVTYGSPITAGVAAALRPTQALEIVAETFASHYTSALGDPRALPWEVVGGLKVFVHRNSYLMLGAGAGVPVGSAPGAAAFRGFVGIVFEPSIGDTDGDGYRDDVDRCPTRPEDFDLFEDSDGCPEPDNDRDGLLDTVDQCPNVPEDRDGDHDDDGCPETDRSDRDGDGLLDSVDQCPDEPEDRDGFQDADGCPDVDNDRDGVLDTVDLCPDDPEDRDRFEDENGCPDPDNDHDRIADTRDRCPNEPETYNGERDDDGCRDEGVIEIGSTVINLFRPINFETNSARIREDSIAIVDAVSRALLGNPQIRLVQVQGHADERGDEQHNLLLTRDRAASVVNALVERGVTRERLHSAGYGERCRAGFPAEPGHPPQNATCQHGGPRWCHTERAWRHDRRVVFLILRNDRGPTGARVVCPDAEELVPDADRSYLRAVAPAP